jgi:hypothetical protein
MLLLGPPFGMFFAAVMMVLSVMSQSPSNDPKDEEEADEQHESYRDIFPVEVRKHCLASKG